ncbi:MAG: DUF1064 domain-containing protein [Pseudomonadota bacterium]|nr:DUF1064 domain-containing protein [Pseudomonadota bacterium]
MSKYRNVKVGQYASKREAKRALELQLLERSGKISALREQVRYEIIPKCGKERAAHYVADFVYMDEAWNLHVEDVKGVKTPAYILKRKLMLHVHGIEIEEV